MSPNQRPKGKFCTTLITADGKALCHFKLRPRVPSFVLTYHLCQTDGCQKHIEWFLFQLYPAAGLRFMDQVTCACESIYQTVENYSNLLVTKVSYCHKWQKWVTRSVFSESQVSLLLQNSSSQNCNLIMSTCNHSCLLWTAVNCNLGSFDQHWLSRQSNVQFGTHTIEAGTWSWWNSAFLYFAPRKCGIGNFLPRTMTCKAKNQDPNGILPLSEALNDEQHRDIQMTPAIHPSLCPALHNVPSLDDSTSLHLCPPWHHHHPPPPQRQHGNAISLQLPAGNPISQLVSGCLALREAVSDSREKVKRGWGMACRLRKSRGWVHI